LDRSCWTPLASATDAARFGHKAATLALLSGGGLPVVQGWVLAVDEAVTEACVDELLLLSDTNSWILRSSSPREDRPGMSAAGCFLSQHAPASQQEVLRALQAVRASATDPRLVDLLGETPQLAILAQAHLSFSSWCTAESRSGELFYEGWRRTQAATQTWTTTSDPDLDKPVAAAVECARVEPALLELGIHGGSPLILQLRAAPLRAPARTQRPVATAQPCTQLGLGAQVHAGDDEREWRADTEHCPTPLSVLLATAFGRWIAADPEHSASRIIDGRWHDARSQDPELSADKARTGYGAWQTRLEGMVAPALIELGQHHAALDGGMQSWSRFHDAWFSLQRAYFSMPGHAARAWARHHLADSERRPGLNATPASARLRRWAALGTHLFAASDAPARTAESVARWVQDHEQDPLARAITETAQRDRVIAPIPYDGFTPGLDEDPWPLYRALAAGIEPPAEQAPPHQQPIDAKEELAAAILVLAESDNERLLECYALWRSALRRIAQQHGLTDARDLHALDIDSLEDWLSGSPFPQAAVTGGRALFSAWSAPREASADESSAHGASADVLQGRAAAGGQARGPVRAGSSLLELAAGGIAVVDTLGPADAIAVGQFDAIVCASGDVLGHASVLCREFSIPCVVGLEQARLRLGRARELWVDGDRGTVRILDQA